MKQSRPDDMHMSRPVDGEAPGVPLTLATSPEGRLPSTEVPHGAAADAAPAPISDVPDAVFLISLVGWGWIFTMFWIVFGGNLESAFMVAVSTVFGIVFFGLAGMMMMLRRDRIARGNSLRKLFRRGMDTWTGPVSGASAFVQVAAIPLALAAAMTLVGVVIMLSRP